MQNARIYSVIQIREGLCDVEESCKIKTPLEEQHHIEKYNSTRFSIRVKIYWVANPYRVTNPLQ